MILCTCVRITELYSTSPLVLMLDKLCLTWHGWISKKCTTLTFSFCVEKELKNPGPCRHLSARTSKDLERK